MILLQLLLLVSIYHQTVIYLPGPEYLFVYLFVYLVIFREKNEKEICVRPFSTNVTPRAADLCVLGVS